MKSIKKHVMVLSFCLLFGIALLLFSNSSYALGRNLTPAATSSGIPASQPAVSQSSDDSEAGSNVYIPSIKKSSEGTLSTDTAKGAQGAVETDSSGWDGSDNAVAGSGITVAPIAESAPVVSSSPPSPKTSPKPQPKPVPKQAPKPAPVQKPAPTPKPAPAPQPEMPPTQPIGNGSSGGGSSSRTVAITGVTMSKKDLTLKKGESVNLTASVSPDNTTQSKEITWSSGNEKIATVDKTGKITAVEGGSVKITAKASNGVSGVCNLTVIVPATKISLNLTDIDLEKGDSRVLTAAAEPADTTDLVSWATSNNDIAAVDTTGKITAVSPGTATVTATAGTASASCTVTVGISIKQLKLSETDLTIKKGESHALTATIDPPDATEDKTVTWMSSDDKVAAVDKDGNVTAVEGGTAVITAQTGTHTAQCTVTVTVPVTGISFESSDISIEKGASQTLTPVFTPDDATDKAVSWTSSDSAVAAVDSSGKVSAIGAGQAVITATSHDGGYSANCTVHVVISIKGITLSDKSLTLNKGGSKTLTVTVDPPDTTEDKTVRWTSSDPSVVAVDSSGNVTAVEGGTAIITAQTGTHTAQCTVTVTVPVTGISFESSDISIEKGASQTLTPIITPDDATDKAVSWTSSDSAVAAVDSSGKVSALSPGMATITATSHDGAFKASCTVHVVISIKSIAISDKSLTLNKGGSKTLTVTVDPPDTTEDKTVRWTSSNPDAATVDSSGNVTAVEGGKTAITAAVGKHTATCDITVIVPVTGISLNPSSLKLAKGAEATLTATLQPVDATDKGISWVSGNPGIVSIDASGKLQAVSVGQATITAASHDGGFQASCTVSVVIPVTGIDIDQTSLTLRKGSMSRLTATVSPAGATDKAVSWTSGNPGVAVVDGSGNITAVGGGTAIITATSHDGGYKTQCTVNVTVPVTGISINKTTDTIKAGATDTLSATVTPTDANDKVFSWSSSNPAVATVDSSGDVTAVSPGSAVIAATSHDGGYTAQCGVTVVRKPVTWVWDNSFMVTPYGLSKNHWPEATGSCLYGESARATFSEPLYINSLEVRLHDNEHCWNFSVDGNLNFPDIAGATTMYCQYSGVDSMTYTYNYNSYTSGIYIFDDDHQGLGFNMYMTIILHTRDYGDVYLGSRCTTADINRVQ